MIYFMAVYLMAMFIFIFFTLKSLNDRC